MHKRIISVLAWFALVALSAPAHCQTHSLIFLECTGRLSIYETWKKFTSSENYSLTVTLDPASKVMSVTFPNTGFLTEPYSESETYYSISKEYAGERLLGKRLDKFLFTINRITGKAIALYKFVNEESMPAAFLGSCAPAKQKF